MDEIIRQAEELKRTFKRATGAHYREYQMLSALSRNNGAMHSMQAAKALGKHPSHATHIGDVLESKGFIQRYRSTEDRRVVTLEMTLRGWDALADWQAYVDSVTVAGVGA